MLIFTSAIPRQPSDIFSSLRTYAQQDKWAGDVIDTLIADSKKESK